jgi:hypothetical protein
MLLTICKGITLLIVMGKLYCGILAEGIRIWIDRYYDVNTDHTVGSLKMDLLRARTVAITNTIATTINYRCLLRWKTLKQYHWEYLSSKFFNSRPSSHTQPHHGRRTRHRAPAVPLHRFCTPLPVQLFTSGIHCLYWL